jgi:hypothetical protein
MVDEKVTFDGPNRIVQVNDGYTELDFLSEIYSAWKRWMLESDNAKYLQALRVVGGDPTTGTDSLGASFFLMNLWQIRSWSGDHELLVTGNVFHDDGYSIFIPVVGPYTVLVTLKVSNLIDRIIQETGGLTEEEAAQLDTAWKNSKLIVPIFGNTS